MDVCTLSELHYSRGMGSLPHNSNLEARLYFLSEGEPFPHPLRMLAASRNPRNGLTKSSQVLPFPENSAKCIKDPWKAISQKRVSRRVWSCNTCKKVE